MRQCHKRLPVETSRDGSFISDVHDLKAIFETCLNVESCSLVFVCVCVC